MGVFMQILKSTLVLFDIKLGVMGVFVQISKSTFGTFRLRMGVGGSFARFFENRAYVPFRKVPTPPGPARAFVHVETKLIR